MIIRVVFLWYNSDQGMIVVVIASTWLHEGKKVDPTENPRLILSKRRA